MKNMYSEADYEKLESVGNFMKISKKRGFATEKKGAKLNKRTKKVSSKWSMEATV